MYCKNENGQTASGQSAFNRTGQITPDMDMCAAREMTIGELLDRRIEKAERLLRTLTDLKSALPGQFLNSGASRVTALLEVQ